MQFGAHIFGVGELANPKILAEVAQLAEALGYHSIFVADHMQGSLASCRAPGQWLALSRDVTGGIAG